MGRRGDKRLEGLLLWPDRPCPRCGAPLERVPRTRLERLAGLLVPSRKYRCSSPACGWEGLWRMEVPGFFQGSRWLRRLAYLALGALLAYGAFAAARFLSERL